MSNPLRAGVKKLRIISTPNGHSNRFHSLWHSADAAFFKHKVTIHDAVAQGLPIDLPLLRRGMADAEAWAQEYECEFLDQRSVLLPYDLIASCESDLATESSTPQLLAASSGEMALGIDFGRKHDLTVASLLEKVPSSLTLNPNLKLSHSASSASTAPSALFPSFSHFFVTREVLVLEKSSTPLQLEALIPRIHRVRRVCVDYTGAGIGLGDMLAHQFGEHQPASPYGRIELCQFTQAFKNEIFTHLRSAFERRVLAIPGSPVIREDLHSIHRVLSANGQVSFRATSSPDGHSDRCTALALALRAAESMPIVAAASSVGRKYPSRR